MSLNKYCLLSSAVLDTVDPKQSTVCSAPSLVAQNDKDIVYTPHREYLGVCPHGLQPYISGVICTSQQSSFKWGLFCCNSISDSTVIELS